MAFYKKTPDIIIRNGKIIDGTGKPAYYADVAIVGDKIDYIGILKDVKAKTEIDAKGKLVTPGFIDSHTHSDFTIWGNPECQSSVRQGVTTEIVGNCGFSKRHRMGETPFHKDSEGIDCIYNLEGPDYPKGSVAAVLDKVEKMGTSMNTAWLCGHNSIRIMANCYTKNYTEEQFKMMEDYLREALEAGFIGFSTGLEFVPGNVCEPEEIERLVKIVAEYDAHYSTHMRNEGAYIFEAVDEFLNVLRKTGVRGTISHLNIKYDNGVPNDYLDKSIKMVEDARYNEGLNVYVDMLPTLFSTGGAIAILPPWLYENGWDKAREILNDPEGRERVKNDCDRYFRFLAVGQWDRLLYISPTYKPELSAIPFKELCKKANRDPFDYFLDILSEASTLEEASNVQIQGIMFKEQTLVDSVVKHPLFLWESDSTTMLEEGEIAETNINMQNYMSITYFLVRYVRELGVISIEDAIKKLGSMPAHHYRLEKRGVLEVGNYADINVFDLDALKINATFAKANCYSSGMDYVIVNGKPVIEKGEHTGVRSGRVLRHKMG